MGIESNVGSIGSIFRKVMSDRVHVLGGALAEHLVVVRRTALSTSMDIRYSSDRTSWTTAGTYTLTGAWTSNPGAARNTLSEDLGSCIDENNNIHVVWFNTSGQLKYVKFTVSGATWTAGTAETVATSSATTGDYGRPVVEAMGGGVILVGWQENNGVVVGGVGAFRSAIRLTGGTWAASWTHAVTNSVLGLMPAEIDPALARGPAAVGNEQYFAAIIGSSTVSSMHVVKVNVSTGAVVSVVDVDTTSPGANWGIFTQTDLPGGALWMGAWGKNGSMAAFTVGTAGYVIHPTNSPTVTVADNDAVTFVPSKRRLAYLPFDPTGHLRVVLACFEDEGLVYLSSAFAWANSISYTGSPIGIQGCSNRNLDLMKPAAIWHGFSPGTGLNQMQCWAEKDWVPAANSVVPLNGSVVNTNTPQLAAKPGTSPSGGYPHKMRWELGTTPGFTVPALVVTEKSSDYNTNPSSVSTTESTAGNGVITGASPWYIRAITIDPWGRASTVPSAENAFTVVHPPTSINRVPGNGAITSFGGGTVNFSWQFSDTSAEDVQASYQIIVERVSDGAVVVDTGEVSSSSSSVGVSISGTYKAVPLRWKVRLRDSDGQLGPYSDYQVFSLYDPPTVTILHPDSETVDNPTPTVTWTFSASDGRTQAMYQVRFIENGHTTPRFDSGRIIGDATTYTPPSPAVDFSKTYQVTVTVWDTFNLTGVDTADDVLASWVPPDEIAWGIADDTYLPLGYVTVVYIPVVELDHAEIRVYRRPAGTTAWTLVHVDGDAVASSDPRSWADFTAVPGVSYEYLVRDVVYRFGSKVESGNDDFQTTIVLDHPDYWLLDLDEPGFGEQHVRIYVVTADDYGMEEERQELNLIGRGRKVDYGTQWGYRGSLTCQIRDHWNPATSSMIKAREVKQRLEAAKAEQQTWHIRNPFGDLFSVALGDVTISRVAGTGNNEYVDMTIPYIQVFE